MSTSVGGIKVKGWGTEAANSGWVPGCRDPSREGHLSVGRGECTEKWGRGRGFWVEERANRQK